MSGRTSLPADHAMPPRRASRTVAGLPRSAAVRNQSSMRTPPPLPRNRMGIRRPPGPRMAIVWKGRFAVDGLARRTAHPVLCTWAEVTMRFGAALLVVWLIIGAIAAGQRGDYNSSHTNCAKTSNVFVTIVAGPLNYVGANPKVSCQLPQ